VLPTDGHVHSQWSWDAPDGSMERTCARAVEIGLGSVAFTEHADFTPWTVLAARVPDHVRGNVTPAGVFLPPELDVEGYLENLRRCRDRFPSLRILSGVELSEPHWHARRAAALLGQSGFDRVLGSVHSIQTSETRFLAVDQAYLEFSAADVVRSYLAEVTRMVEMCDTFAVLAHIDYPVRYWPTGSGTYDPGLFEEDYRQALSALAATSRALEVNTRVPLGPEIVRWGHEAGGEAIAFGSDAHDPTALAHGFADAAAMVEAQGFPPGPDPYRLWRRS
jgi:histidinol-phosphatase (PHP family)